MLPLLALTLAVPLNTAEPPTLIPREVLFGNPDRAGVQVSPDGAWISYRAPLDGVMNVWVEPIDGGEARAVTRSTDRPIARYSWAWNGEQMLYLQDEGGDENNHVFVVDIASGEVTDLTPYGGVAASILDVHRDRPDEVLVQMNNRNAQNMDVHRINLRTGESTPVFINEEGFAGMVPDDDWNIRARMKFTEDGGTKVEWREHAESAWTDLAAIPMEDAMTTAPGGFTKDGSGMYMADSIGRNTSAFVKVTRGDDGTVEKEVIFENDRTDISDMMMNPITGEPEAVATTYLRKQWTVFDEDIAADFKALAALDDGDMEVLSRSGDDRDWIVGYLDDDGPVKYYHWDRDEQQGRFLFTNRSDLDGYTLAPMESVEIKARDGLVLPSYLTRPPNADEVTPMVLLVHGGPWARDEWGYNPYHQWLANRGYAVLSVNFRGSTGFGKNHINAANREWAGKMQDDLTDAVAWAVAEGIADPDRVAIMGGSYGGYATLVGMTFTPELYACGVDIVGPSHVRTLLETIPPYWKPIVSMFESRVGGLDEPEYLDEISPLTKVDEIQRPLLIGQGKNDPRVKVSESDQIVAAMQERELPVTYVVFPDEGHGFRKPENNRAFNAITETFLAKHLGGRAEAIGSDVTNSTAEVRSFGNLDLPGVIPWEPSEELEIVTETGDIAFEDLSADHQQQATAALEQMGNIDVAMLPMIVQQLTSQLPMIPEADRPLVQYLLQALQEKIDGTGDSGDSGDAAGSDGDG